MSAVVTDTHALIWYLFEPRRLSEAARDVFRTAESEGQPIYVPTICIVEICYLIDKRIIAENVFAALISTLQDTASAPTAIPLTLDIAARMRNVPKTEVADMPDRVIASTALHLGLPLVTRDRKIRASHECIW